MFFAYRIFALSGSDAILEAALLICIIGLTWCCGGVSKLLLRGNVVQTGAQTWAEAGQTEEREKKEDFRSTNSNLSLFGPDLKILLKAGWEKKKLARCKDFSQTIKWTVFFFSLNNNG